MDSEENQRMQAEKVSKKARGERQARAEEREVRLQRRHEESAKQELKREKSGFKEGASESAKQQLEKQLKRAKWGWTDAEKDTGHAKEQVAYSDGVASMRFR